MCLMPFEFPSGSSDSIYKARRGSAVFVGTRLYLSLKYKVRSHASVYTMLIDYPSLSPHLLPMLSEKGKAKNISFLILNKYYIIQKIQQFTPNQVTARSVIFNYSSVCNFLYTS